MYPVGRHRYTCNFEGDVYDQSISFEYDANGNRTSMTDSAGQTTYTYDNRNRCTSKTRTIEGQPYIISYQYDAASHLVSMTYPDQTVVINEYDALSRLTAKPGYAQFTYNDDSLLSSMVFSNGVTTTYQYDDCDRPTSIRAEKNDTELLVMDYQYDLAGNISQLDYNRTLPDQQSAQSTEIFQYDWLDRLISAQGDYGSLLYLYDPVGNRISSSSSIYTYNVVNELVSISDGTTFTYDEAGNTVTKNDSTSAWSYTYDASNQLIQVEKDQQMIGQYEYDGDGHRIKKTEWIESLQEYHTIIYVYSGSSVIYEKNINTDQEATYVYGPTDRIAKNAGGSTDFYHTDHLRSTRLVTDETGNVVTEASYKPFGESSTTGEEELYLYNGKERSPTGLYYYGARYYDPEIGRFITRDQNSGGINDPRTLNRYVYCANNPLKYIDLDGRDYFLPDWAYHERLGSLGDFSLKGALESFQLWFQKGITKMMAQVGGWMKKHEDSAAYASIVGGATSGAVVTEIAGSGIGLIGAISLGVCYYEFTKSAKFYHDLWFHDPHFVALYTTAETYATMLEMGIDCGQEATDAFVELEVYMLQQRYGSNWRSHAHASTLAYYDEMMKRKESQSAHDSQQEDPPSESSDPPQFDERKTPT